MAFLKFDAQAVAPQRAPEVIPAGKYNAVVTDSEIAPSRSGQMLKLTMQIIEGPFSGRKVFTNLNIQNSNQQAEQIAQAQLSALCHATGVMQLQDTAQLHNKPVQIRVSIKKDDTGQYEDKNEVKAFAPVTGGAPTPGAAFPPAAAPGYSALPAAGFTPRDGGSPATATAPSTPPWQRTAA